MTLPKSEPERQLGPPGDRIKRLARRSGFLSLLLKHSHILQVVDDHQGMWLECQSESERRSVRLRLKRQIARAIAVTVGLDIGMHGVYTLFAVDPVHGAGLALLGFAAAYWASRGGG